MEYTLTISEYERVSLLLWIEKSIEQCDDMVAKDYIFYMKERNTLRDLYHRVDELKS